MDQGVMVRVGIIWPQEPRMLVLEAEGKRANLGQHALYLYRAPRHGTARHGVVLCCPPQPPQCAGWGHVRAPAQYVGVRSAEPARFHAEGAGRHLFAQEQDELDPVAVGALELVPKIYYKVQITK